jgi:hypothetical protein
LARPGEQADLAREVQAPERLVDAALEGLVVQKRPRPKKPRMSRTITTMMRIVMIETANGGASMWGDLPK